MLAMHVPLCRERYGLLSPHHAHLLLWLDPQRDR